MIKSITTAIGISSVIATAYCNTATTDDINLNHYKKVNEGIYTVDITNSTADIIPSYIITKSDLEQITDIVSKKFSKVIDTWIPESYGNEKTCLFLRLKDQDYLFDTHEDLPYEVYLSVKDIIQNSDKFDMVALF